MILDCTVRVEDDQWCPVRCSDGTVDLSTLGTWQDETESEAGHGLVSTDGHPWSCRSWPPYRMAPTTRLYDHCGSTGASSPCIQSMRARLRRGGSMWSN